MNSIRSFLLLLILLSLPLLSVSGQGDSCDFKNQGVFKEADIKLQETILDIFKHYSPKKLDPSKVRRMEEKDLNIDISSMNSEQIKDLRHKGIENLNKLSIVTSAAGLWTRGGGQVKALTPYNLKEIIGEQNFIKLQKYNNIINAPTPEELLKAAGKQSVDSSTDSSLVQKNFLKAKEGIEKIMKDVEKNPKALTPMDIKLINVALLSHEAKTYIPLDFWTSQQTHSKVKNYLEWFSQNFQTKILHPDALKNAQIKKQLEEYFKISKEKGETHLLGYQEDLHAISSSTQKFNPETPVIGAGAGEITNVLVRSGRKKELEEVFKKNDFVFENIEVCSDYATLYGAHLNTKKDVSVVLVAQKEGYAGGNPFMVKKDEKKDQWNMQLLEQSNLDDSFKTGNKYFNTNTIFMNLNTEIPKDYSFEYKNQRRDVRTRINVGDVTFNNDSGSIKGRIPSEYENFKNYSEYGNNGEKYIKDIQENWKKQITD